MKFADLKPQRKPAHGQPWVMEVPVLSTGHLPEAERAIINDYTEAEPGVLAVSPAFGTLFFIIEDGADDIATNLPTLAGIARRLSEAGFHYLRLDPDGELFDDLPQFTHT